MDVPAPQPRPPSLTGARAELPKTIGPFKVLKKIGEGGMGVVFLAQQEHPTRLVAVKVILTGALSPRTLRRFEHEGEMLARLQHPGIAQIYQAGTYETEQGVLPYFAMEHVEGERLDHYAHTHALPLRARLELAAKIADAVEHAHQKGVIHRDLKPGNILVTATGQPKILDFGVGRLEDDDSRTTTLRTDMGALLGTLPYMSPEQAGGNPQAVDARADVYSLGVVFYELLTGKLPYALDRAALPEAVRVIQEEEPSKLSSHDRALRGDVETIVGKALEKDKTRRYASAQALGDDIRRHLADEPILARPPSTWYQLTKFARRNQVLVGGIAAVLLTSLAGAGVATHLYLREREANAGERTARLEAETQQKRAQKAADFLRSIFQGIDPRIAQGADTTLLQRILGDARARLAQELADQPEVEAELRSTLGNAYLELNLFEDAGAEFERALELRTRLFGADDPRTQANRLDLAHLFTRRGELRAAEELQRSILEQQQTQDGGGLRAKRGLAETLMRQGRYRESEQTLREILKAEEDAPESNGEIPYVTRMSLAQTLTFQGKLGEARELLEQTLQARSERLGDDHPSTIAALGALAVVLEDLHHYADAEAAQRDALERAQRILGEDNQQTLVILNNLAVCLEDMNRKAEAEAVLRDCLARRKRALGEENLETLGTYTLLGKFLWEQERFDEAAPLILGAFETMRRVLGEDSQQTMIARFQVARVLSQQNRPLEAAEQLEKIAARNREVLPEENPDRPLSLYNWAGKLQDAGEKAASEAPLREALALVETYGHQGEPFVPAAKNALAKVLEEQGKTEEADALFRSALSMRRSQYGPIHAEVAYSLSDYGEALLERGDAAAAEPLLAELVKIQTKLSGPNDWRLASARQLAGHGLALLGRFDEAEELLLQACEVFAKLPDALPSAARQARANLLALYAAWDAAEPGQGIAERAARWQTKFPAE